METDRHNDSHMTLELEKLHSDPGLATSMINSMILVGYLALLNYKHPCR